MDNEDGRAGEHPTAARVGIALLTGPSGAGKSALAARSGLPTVCLDDFYRDGDEDDLPRLDDGGVDWDHPGAWDAERAVSTLQSLATSGRAELPIYDLARDRTVGTHHLDVRGAPLVIAEGIFAAELIDPCRRRGLLVDALCLTGGRTRTFWWRLRRDLKEGRKAPLTLLRRGWRLRAAEPDLIASHATLGARVVDHRRALQRLAELAATDRTRRDTAA